MSTPVCLQFYGDYISDEHLREMVSDWFSIPASVKCCEVSNFFADEALVTCERATNTTQHNTHTNTHTHTHTHTHRLTAMLGSRQ